MTSSKTQPNDDLRRDYAYRDHYPSEDMKKPPRGREVDNSSRLPGELSEELWQMAERERVNQDSKVFQEELRRLDKIQVSLSIIALVFSLACLATGALDDMLFLFIVGFVTTLINTFLLMAASFRLSNLW